jgi:hypothetical protein
MLVLTAFAGVGAMKRYLILVLSAAALALHAPAAAQSGVSVTRKASNLYKVDGRPIWIQTRYCYVYAYSEDVAVTRNDQLIFLDDDDECDIKQVLGEMTLRSGNYDVRVSYEDTDLYSTLGGILIHTSGCLHLGMSDDAVLRMNSVGTGTIVFLDNGRRCQVEVVLSQ